ncbi:uncharacterized protein V6R79_018313 [Siganus canaliculatus]
MTRTSALKFASTPDEDKQPPDRKRSGGQPAGERGQGLDLLMWKECLGGSVLFGPNTLTSHVPLVQSVLSKALICIKVQHIHNVAVAALSRYWGKKKKKKERKNMNSKGKALCMCNTVTFSIKSKEKFEAFQEVKDVISARLKSETFQALRLSVRSLRFLLYVDELRKLTERFEKVVRYDLNLNDLYFWRKKKNLKRDGCVCGSYSMLSIFICFCTAASALGQVTKEQVGVFFPHIFNQSVSVYICICIEQRDAECQKIEDAVKNNNNNNKNSSVKEMETNSTIFADFLCDEIL